MFILLFFLIAGQLSFAVAVEEAEACYKGNDEEKGSADGDTNYDGDFEGVVRG